MASVTSLGLHQPTALQYAIQEQLLPENPPTSSYEWDITVDQATGGDSDGEDELLVTKDSVIWSRGCIFRKCFGFKLEKEPITQALLTYFPCSENDTDSEAAKSKNASRVMSKALVVLLKSQAHIYFLDGTSHVVHMPFEVESACAAPQGLIIQRKQRSDSGTISSLKFPKVPPNSFISNQVSPVSARTSQLSTFTTETLGKPKALPLRLSSNFDNLWDAPEEKNDSTWPRLVALTDPLLELGLVVTQPEKSAKQKSRKSLGGRAPNFLDRAEEILHVEAIHPRGTSTETRIGKLVLAVTVNRETSMYTVWRLSYIHNEDPFIGSRKKSKRKPGPRRSSMQPGLPSGATTPLQTNFKESFGAPLPGKRPRKSEKIEKNDRALEKLESSLGIDKESGVTRRTSRRVSSMLARADLSASQDRAGFVEQAQIAGIANTRRDTSLGSQRNRTSGAFSGPSFSGSINYPGNTLGSFLEAPVDTLLEELRVGGDFEGFHTMGLDDHDFDGLAQEVLLTKIHSIPIDNSNVRYSLSKQPARKQCKVFCVCGPQVTTDGYERQQVLVGIQDPMEKRLQLLTLHLQSNKTSSGIYEPDKTVVTFGQLKKAQNVIDSSKITDGNISMILVLSQANNGQRELSVQAPWSPFTPISCPQKLSLANLRSLDYRGSLVNREVGIRRAVTPEIGEIAGMRHPKLHGVVDIVDGDTQQLHQIRIQLQPVSPQVLKILDVIRSVIPSTFGDNLIAGWWDILAWLRQQDLDLVDIEWSAIVIQMMSMYLALDVENAASLVDQAPKRRSRSFLRSSSGAQIDLGDWESMNIYETPGSLTHPAWAENKAWQWMMEEDDSDMFMFQPNINKHGSDFLTSHMKRALAYLSSGRDAVYGQQSYLPTAPGIDSTGRARHAQDMFLALHILLEEQKLNITSPHTTSPGPTDLRAVLFRIALWMKWPTWTSLYELEMPLDWPENHAELEIVMVSLLPTEPDYWGVFDWIQANLSRESKSPLPIPALSSFISCSTIPRIRMFDTLFRKLGLRSQSPTDYVEAMYESGITLVVLESLPESVLVPLQDAISQCQASPPPGWEKEMLELVNRNDIGSILSQSNHSHFHQANLLAPTHIASWDFNSLCQNVMDFNDAPADDVAESDKQAVIRAIFKEDRRLDETKMMLNTTKPRSVRLDPLPKWTEPMYLEQQKELVTRLATNTLSIPAGRGLMNYGLRFPLLTQKFHINGFVLNCTVKPNNVTVGVDKTLFTEEKIAWAFFHSGVAGGLSISRQAKGIDTSWILYNKPGNDLNNRHAGFLLALGLNGHLKGVAKWVAFKYLTPKHTMTSIGLLLGLAASYLGTMDSLITRLLSVHVTRMLPRGAAELNLSPLTQTTGIMGIGLLYCNSQHRRMSEIMMSEIEHIESDDDEEPLRSECYRLAAGFALGFINLGKGTDLKGLHDMRITEKLLTLASTTKKVEHVHILDRASAAAVVAIALIYMKSEDHIVARKIDVPDAILQFDYIRPDILLLRTVAKHLILWSEIDSSHEWIRKNLPRRYHSRVHPPTQSFDHSSRGPLNSTHLPFLTILAGLCFSMALRFAGSGNLTVRDLLLSYLHRYYGLCRTSRSKASFDERCVLVTARMCLDVVALSCATVMAGTCDLKVLRIIRSLHGRSDSETTYGSHMATHMAIGVLSLGCGTQTFSTSNLAIASLLVAFYPVFPDTVQDNKSHLQAFRHFWVLATDPRCLVTKDVATNAPVSVPIFIRLQNSASVVKEELRTTPCLLPPLNEISSLRTQSPEFWNLELDFNAHPEYADAFKRTQALYLRRRPVSDSPFAATILALGRQDGVPTSASPQGASQPLEWLFNNVPSLQKLTHAERGIVLDRGVGGPDVGDSAANVVDVRLILEEAVRGGRRDDLLGLRGLFNWFEWRARRAQEDQKRDGHGEDKESKEADNINWIGEGWLRESIVESLKGGVWLAGRE